MFYLILSRDTLTKEIKKEIKFFLKGAQIFFERIW